MPKWTGEQLEAISAYGRPVIVSAAAGSGKTAVLVERTIRLLSDEKLNIPADSLLAVTFTNDAAAQMRQKLSAAFEKAAEEAPDNRWVQKQQSLLRLADICTINSFCFDMVRNNLSSTDFQSGIRIMDDTEAGMITDRALESVMENAFTQRPQETEELVSRFCRENDSSLRKMVLKLYKFLRSLPFKKLWTDKVISSLEDGSQLERIFEDLSCRAAQECEALANIANRLEDLAQGLEYHAAAKDIFLKNCDYARTLAQSPQVSDYDGCRSLFSNLSWTDLKGARQTKAEKLSSGEEKNILYESAKSCYNRLKKKALDIADCCKYTREAAEQDAILVKDSFSQLVRLTDELEKEVMRVKIERNAVDFADTELLTVNLLVNCDSDGKLTRTPLAQEIIDSRRYGLILIDEFQDVNNLQEVIFKAVSNSEDMSEIGSNVFCVGDVKQAIYRFRQANPAIFMNTRAQGQSEDSDVREILLTRNFRSRGSVLDFSNYIFSSLMTTELGEVSYTKSEELALGAGFEGEDPPCEIITVNTDADEDGEAPDEFSAIARKIRRMIDDRVTVAEGGVQRPCRPGDFCILTRNNVSTDALNQAFSAEGLKILSSGLSGYLGSREISLMLNLLTVTVSPMRDIPLAGVMLSPIMAFSDDDIAEIKLVDKKSRLYKNMLAVSLREDGSPLCERSKSAIELIKRLKIYSARLPLTRFIKKIYDITDIFAMAAAYEDAKQKCANLYLLLEYAKTYESSSNDGVAGFLRYIEYITKSGGDFAEAMVVTESEDAVNVKTIHKSKGLEYPFVFICQLSKRFNKTDILSRLMLNSSYGAGLSFLDYKSLTKRSTIFWDYIAEKNASELLSEELRLLYVACTRAKEKLFVVLSINDNTAERAAEYSGEISGHIVPPSLSKRAVCAQDWMIMALMKHPQMDILRKSLPDSAYADPTELSPQICVSEPLPPSGRAISEPEKTDVSENRELTRRILKSFEYKNDPNLCSREAKISVSELVNDDPLTFFPKVPRLDDTMGELTAAQKGTVMHRFMQLADYAAAARNLEDEISRLTETGAFTQKEADSISRKSLKAFFESAIYKRMSGSPNVMREKSFIVRFDDISLDEELKQAYSGTDGMLQGIADCVFEEDDGYVLVDYKTDRVSSLEDLKDRYSAQLTLYKAAFDILLDKPVKSCYIYSYALAWGIEVGLT